MWHEQRRADTRSTVFIVTHAAQGGPAAPAVAQAAGWLARAVGHTVAGGGVAPNESVSP